MIGRLEFIGKRQTPQIPPQRPPVVAGPSEAACGGRPERARLW